MGETTLAAYGVLTLVGITLLARGALRQDRALLALASAALLAVAGLWMFGLLGAALGLIAFSFWRHRKVGPLSAAG